MISNKGLVTISAFMSSCDDLINGKFIFAGNKVANILKSINESPELYEVISECLKNFNYEKEFGRAKVKLPTKRGSFKMPEENTAIIPLVFCMLVEIQEGKIDFKQFLADYFETDDDNSQFENFANQVIVPFKNAIAFLFEIEGDNKFKPVEDKPERREEPAKVSSKEDKFFETVKDIASQILDDIEYIKVKEDVAEDVKYMAETLLYAVGKKDIKMTNAIIIGTCYILNQVRKLRMYERMLRSALEELYL